MTDTKQPEKPIAYFDFQKRGFYWATYTYIGPIPVARKVEPMPLYLSHQQAQPEPTGLPFVPWSKEAEMRESWTQQPAVQETSMLTYDDGFLAGEMQAKEQFNRTKQEAPIKQAQPEPIEVPQIHEYEEVLKDHRRLVRELDVILNGESAAQQASLCDLVAQIKQAQPEPSKQQSIKEASMINLPKTVAWFAEYDDKIYTEAQLKQAVRDAYEDAAKVCDKSWNGDSESVDYVAACNDCAEVIRALIKEIDA